MSRQKRAVGDYHAPIMYYHAPQPTRVIPRPVPTAGVAPQRLAHVQAPVPTPALIPIAQAPAAAPVPRVSRRPPMANMEQQNVIEDLARQLRDLHVETGGLRKEPAPGQADNRPRNPLPRRCVWCDSLDHMRGEFPELGEIIRVGLVRYQDGRIHLVVTGE